MEQGPSQSAEKLIRVGRQGILPPHPDAPIDPAFRPRGVLFRADLHCWDSQDTP